jgi:hypothetical protein
MKKVALILACGLVPFLQSAANSPASSTTTFGKALSESRAPEKREQAGKHDGQIESKYDGFAHETVIALKKMRVSCKVMEGNFSKDVCVNLAASLHCPGIQLDYVRHATWQLLFETEAWDQRHPLDQRNLSVVADGETIRLGRMELVGQNVDTKMTEILEVTMPYRTFKKIALAQVVEIQVGKSKLELKEKNLAALRDLNNRVKF